MFWVSICTLFKSIKSNLLKCILSYPDCTNVNIEYLIKWAEDFFCWRFNAYANVFFWQGDVLLRHTVDVGTDLSSLRFFPGYTKGLDGGCQQNLSCIIANYVMETLICKKFMYWITFTLSYFLAVVVENESKKEYNL